MTQIILYLYLVKIVIILSSCYAFQL